MSGTQHVSCPPEPFDFYRIQDSEVDDQEMAPNAQNIEFQLSGQGQHYSMDHTNNETLGATQHLDFELADEGRLSNEMVISNNNPYHLDTDFDNDMITPGSSFTAETNEFGTMEHHNSGQMVPDFQQPHVETQPMQQVQALTVNDQLVNQIQSVSAAPNQQQFDSTFAYVHPFNFRTQLGHAPVQNTPVAQEIGQASAIYQLGFPTQGTFRTASYGDFQPPPQTSPYGPQYGLTPQYPGPPTAAAQPPHHGRADSNGGGLKVPIPANRSNDVRRDSGGNSPSTPGSDAGKDDGMTVQQSGPMSSSHVVPSRPKPGRKPIPVEDAADRRRFQNRMAQRVFRDKRQQKLVAAIDEIKDMKDAHEREIGEHRRQFDQLKQQAASIQKQMQDALEETRQQRQRAEQRADDLERRLRAAEEQVARYQQRTHNSMTAGFAASTTPGNAAGTIGAFRAMQHPHASSEANEDANGGPSPPASEPYEIDFTNYGRTTQAPSTYGLRVSTSNESNEMDFTFERSDDKCGFCTDDQNCACKQEKVVERVIEAPVGARSVTLPGSCDMCRADPVRAQACRDMARSTNMSAQTPVSTPTSETPRTSIFDSRSGQTVNMPPPRMSCSSMVDAFNKFGERTSSIASLFGGKALTTYPAATGGYEFEETQAAEVLSTLSRRSTMAESPQPDDGRRPSTAGARIK